ncbi:uncharacterized protein [Centruroides vittatus]|uniref:uncharacterized protein n=1 Tax=Centruroides vittatus TaxID=120091 RepID=UPI003510BDB7
MQQFVDSELAAEQAGFRKGRGTRDHIANIRWIMEKAIEFQKDVTCVLLIRVKLNKIWRTLKDMSLPDHIINLLQALYHNQEATVRTVYGDTNWLTVDKGVRRSASQDTDLGFHIGGKIINNLRYVDDTTLLAESEEDLVSLIKSIKDESEKMDLKLNIQKIKVMTTAELQRKVTIDDYELEIVDNFIFLGSKLNRIGACTEEIKRRLTLGRTALTSGKAETSQYLLRPDWSRQLCSQSQSMVVKAGQ